MPEGHRNTKKLTLRLSPPELVDEIKTFADSTGCTISDVVAAGFRALMSRSAAMILVDKASKRRLRKAWRRGTNKKEEG